MSTEDSQQKDATQQTPTFTNPSPFGSSTLGSSPPLGSSLLGSSPPADRRMSDEWDASKVPPSRFQKRKGSIYAVPNSRDGHVDSNYQAKFHEKHTEKGYQSKK